jgi:hypothetical protein
LNRLAAGFDWRNDGGVSAQISNLFADYRRDILALVQYPFDSPIA